MELGPGNQSLIFTWSSTGQPNEVQRLSIGRSDNGGVVLLGPVSVSGLNGSIAANITATQLIMDHPNTGFGQQTTGPRPAGRTCTVVNPNPDFGEVVLGLTNAALATITKTVTLRNDGLDCLTINSITNSAPYSLTAASAALLPITLDPTKTVDINIVFAPAAPGNSFNRTLDITRTPANGDSQINCKGKARAAVASIATSTNTLAFGTVVIPPGTGTRTFTVTNTSEINLSITIAAAPVGSDFTWVPIGGAGLALPVRRDHRGTKPSASPPRPTAPRRGGRSPSRRPWARRKPSPAAERKAASPTRRSPCPPPRRSSLGRCSAASVSIRLIGINGGDDDPDLQFRASIGAGVVPRGRRISGLVLPETTSPTRRRRETIRFCQPTRCGTGPTGNNVQTVAVSFFANGASGMFAANLIIDNHNATNFPAAQTWTFPLSAEIIDPVPVDIALVIGQPAAADDPVRSRNKMAPRS